MANAIQTIEGYYPGSVAYKNNNPGNLVYAGQANATQGANGFAVFDNYQDGYQALLNQLNLDASRGLTISQEMAKWAPAGQGSNDPTAYANQVAAAQGVSVDTPLTVAFNTAPAGVAPSTDYVTPDDSSLLASVGLPDLGTDLSQIDPAWLAAGAVGLALLAYMAVS